MDTKTIGTVENDAGQSGSDGENGVGKSGGADERIALRNDGFIDADLARRTGGNGGGSNSASAAPRGRGRHPNACTCANCTAKRAGQPIPTKTAKTSGLNINGIEKILFSIHAVIASTLNVPEIELDEEEAKRLGFAIQNVSSAYKVEFDPKKAAMVDLVTACGVIYGPRAVSIYMRKKDENKMRRTPFAQPKPQQPNKAPPSPNFNSQPANTSFNQPSLDNSGQPPELNENKNAPLGKMPDGFDPKNIKMN